MYRLQANQLRGITGYQVTELDLKSINNALKAIAGQTENIGQVLSGCGPLEHDVENFMIHLYGDSSQTAGIGDDHAVLRVSQWNERAGTTEQPRLYSAWFDGPVLFKAPIHGAIRKATATANWNSTASTVAAKDVSSTPNRAITITLYSNAAGMQPNVRNGDTVYYQYLPDRTPVALSEDDVIGTVKFVNGAAAIKGGWQVADGTNGTLNLVNASFPYLKMHATTAGTTGGAATHVHALTGALDTTTLAMTGNPSLTGGPTLSGIPGGTVGGSGTLTTDGYTLTIADHPAHNHPLDTQSNAVAGAGVWGSATAVTGSAAAMSHTISSANPHTHDILTHTHGFTGSIGTLATGIGTLAATVGTLAVDPNPHGHTLGTLATVAANHEPPSTTVIPIQRVN